MKGWKTWTAVALVVASGVINMLGKQGTIDPEIAAALSQAILSVGGAFGLVGLGAKIERNK